MQVVAVRPRVLEALAVRDAAARGHPVDFVRVDLLFDAQAVAMHDPAREQIGHRRQADMRMRAHVDAAVDARGQVERSDVVEEDERPHHAPLGERQHAADFETAAQAAAALLDDHVNHGFHGSIVD